MFTARADSVATILADCDRLHVPCEQVDGSLGGPYSKQSPPQGMRFAGYHEGATGCVWEPAAAAAAETRPLPQQSSAAVLNRLFSQLLPAGDEAGVSALVDAGTIDVDLRVGKGPNCQHTLLHWAAYRDQRTLVEALLERGADRTLQDAQRRTPLELALESGHTDVVEALCGGVDLLAPGDGSEETDGATQAAGFMVRVAVKSSGGAAATVDADESDGAQMKGGARLHKTLLPPGFVAGEFRRRRKGMYYDKDGIAGPGYYRGSGKDNI